MYSLQDHFCLIRNKAGLWGWRSDKSEMINGHICKVFSASNVELITKTRLEHLSEPDKLRARAPRTPLQSFLGIAEQQLENYLSATTSVISSPFFLLHILRDPMHTIAAELIYEIICFRKNITMLEIIQTSRPKSILIQMLI